MSGAAGRRERQPAAIPRVERDPLRQPSGGFASVLVSESKIPRTMAHGAEPSAAGPIRSRPRSIASDPCRPVDRAEFHFFARARSRAIGSSAISLSLLGLPAPRSASHHNLGSGSLPAQRCHHPPGIRLPCCPRRQRLHPAPHRAPTLSSQQLQPAPLPACHCRSIRACVTLCGNQLVS